MRTVSGCSFRLKAEATQNKKRSFFATFAAGSFFAIFVVSLACAPRPPAPPAQQVEAPVDVVELSVAEAQKRMAAGTLSSRALTSAYLDRIAAVDDAGPQLNAVIDISPTAIQDAEARDAERRAGKARGALHGIPVLVKDNIDVAGMINSAGSLAFVDNRPAADAFLVARLRDAGVVILGKANLSEWANFRSTKSTSGWSSRGGQTKNPYALDRNPCGSSSGSAVAVAASLATVSIGTETDGSIICPASVNGVVGLKPTVGLVSRSGIIPIAASQDTAGPMGRTVADVAALLSGMAGVDNRDPAVGRGPTEVPDYAAFLDAASLNGQRIGVFRRGLKLPPDVDVAMKAAVEVMQKAGATVVDVQMRTYGKWDDVELDVLLYEFKDGLNAYLAGSSSGQKSLAAIIEWNKANEPLVMPLFGQELFERAQAKGPLTDPSYVKARDTARRLAGSEGLLAALAGQKLAAVIAPSTGPAWKLDYKAGDRSAPIGGYGAAAVAGTPSITIPIGESGGLPFGLTFMGAPFSEPQLIGFAYALEQATSARKQPQFRATVDK